MSNDILTKIRSTADILGGEAFFANDLGQDPEHLSVDDLLPNGLYIRLNGSDGTIAYISAHEIDKAIGIIGDMTMGKANAADVEEIRDSLSEKVSKTEFNILRTDVDNKATKLDVDNMIDLLDAKADQSTVDALQTEVDAKADQSTVDALQTEVDAKAANDDVMNIISDIEALQATVALLTDSSSITSINRQIEYLNSELRKKLEIDDIQLYINELGIMSDNIDAIIARLDNVDIDLNKKATKTYVQQQVNELNAAINGLVKRVDNKADKAAMISKADKTDLDTALSRLNALSTTVSELELSTDNNNDYLTEQLSLKATKAYVDSIKTNLEAALLEKVDKTTFNASISEINTKLNNLEESQSSGVSGLSQAFYDLECSVNNSLITMNSNITVNSKKLDSQAEQLLKLQESDKKQNESLKNEWVRVMSPDEYKRLAPVGDTFSDGTPNPYAKKANVLYMLIKYNKPVSVYIGDVLIAQAEKKGSAGFAYSFPIVF